MIKNKDTIVKKSLSNFPIISVGLVSSLSTWMAFLVKIISEPNIINSENIENKIKFKIKLKFPFFISPMFSHI